MAGPNSLHEDQRRHPFIVPPADWPGQISIGRVALSVGLIAGALSLFFVFGLNARLQAGQVVMMHALLELLIVVGATHVVSVGAGLWLSHREPRWMVLATGFAIVSAFYIGHLIYFLQALAAETELKDNAWVRVQEALSALFCSYPP